MDLSNDTFKSASLDELEKNGKKKAPGGEDVSEWISNERSEEEEYIRKSRKRLVIIVVSSLILLLLIIGAIWGILVPMNKKNSSSPFSSSQDSIIKVCNTTLYRDSCYSSIYSLKMSTGESPGHDDDPDTPREIFKLSLQVALNELTRLKSSISERFDAYINDSITQNALDSCKNLCQDAVDHVNMSVASWQLENADRFMVHYVIRDIRTWLSTAITDQETCLYGLREFESIPKTLHEEMKAAMQNATEFTSNSLAIISNVFDNFSRKLFEVHEKKFMARRLLEAEQMNLRPNLTVARDGSRDYRTITEAVNSVPTGSDHRFYIYVKEGVYEEQVAVNSDVWNLMIYGDGMNKTIVSGRLNYADGVATFNSGSFIVEGRGFIARDMGFKNTAGPKKLQAVALRSSSDQSIFHRCSFDAYQDTLYIHTNRQFYTGCLITGTIDFIFGNAAAVFQNCSIQPRQPGSGQYNTITAQSKSDPNQDTGISIQKSVISPYDNLTAQTFFGRPWNNYSTTIVMATEIQGIIDPAGWSPWQPGTDPPGTILYAEYKNTGPGSVLVQRVMWPGYRPDITEEEADKFSVEQFIQGSQWLIKANVGYDPHV